MPQLLKSALPFLLAAICGTSPVSVAAQNLGSTEWAPVDIAGDAADISEKMFILFEADGTVSGNGGCNSFRGRYVTNGDALLLGPAAATLMMCEDSILKGETAFFHSLSQARVFVIDGSKLTLTDADGGPVMQLEQRNAN